MSTAIAFLSGKGGSGKTTLALSMADLLCRCKIRTLLIDCDLSTNGATYFYESRLTGRNSEKSSSPLSLSDILSLQDYSEIVSPLKINPYYDFIPSISEISDHQLVDGNVLNQRDMGFKLRNLLSWSQQNYDVILFDCQAGYTELLPALLPLMDVDIFVLEADSISASAMRSLHLKIGSCLGHAKLFQVFNKATSEEFEIYSKIVGTFFTNIGTLLFDWKIRQAFSRSQIPDLMNSSAKYGADLCDICKIVLPDTTIQEKLSSFSTNLLYMQAKEERKQTLKEIEELIKHQPKLTKYLNLWLLSLVIFATLILLYNIYSSDNYKLNDSSTILAMLSIYVTSISLLAFLLKQADSSSENRKLRYSYERKLKEIDDKIKKLDHLRQSKNVD